MLDITDIVAAGGERGLLGVAPHPDPADDRVFVYYTDLDGRQLVSSFRANPGDPDRLRRDSEVVLLAMEDPFPNHNGGGLAFGPDGYLYVSTGDGGGGGDPLGSGRDLGTLLGKILRLDVDVEAAAQPPYGIPPDNPFVDHAGARAEIWHTGLRNPFRFRFDAATGDLWIGDVGQNAWEEVDLAPGGVGGLDFGWNLLEGTHCFAADPCDADGLTPPVVEYGHDEGCAVTGGAVYRGTARPALRGSYVFADYCSGRFWAIDAEAAAVAAAEGRLSDPTVVLDSGRSISAIAAGPDGELFATDLDRGELLRIEVAATPVDKQPPPAPATAPAPDPAPSLPLAQPPTAPAPDPAPAPAEQVPPPTAASKVVDDEAFAFNKAKPGWKTQKAGAQGGSYWTTVQKREAKHEATWTASLDAPGRYGVWVRFPEENATTRAARYRILTSGAVVVRKVDQARKGGKWVDLGTYEFGTVAQVTLTDKTGERTSAGRRVVYDVVRFVPIDVAVAALTPEPAVPVVETTHVVPPEPAPVDAASEPTAEPEVETEPKPEAKVEPAQDVESEPEVGEGEPKPEAKAEPAQDVESEPESETSAEPKPEAKAEPDLKEKAEPKAEPEPNPQNQAPVADAGGPYELDEGAAIELDGSLSSDPDGSIVSYAWSREQRLDDPTAKRPVFTALDDGVFDIELTVTDEMGASDTASAEVRVRNVDPGLAELGAFTVDVGDELVLAGMSIRDPGANDAHELTVEWGDGMSTGASIHEDGTASASHVYAAPGDYVITLMVRDDDGGTGSQQAVVSVWPIQAAEEGIVGEDAVTE